jgi:hypothetical protein
MAIGSLMGTMKSTLYRRKAFGGAIGLWVGSYRLKAQMQR